MVQSTIGQSDVSDETVRDFLTDVASPATETGSGPASAVVVAVAAAIVRKVARLSFSGWEDAPGIAAQAETLERRASELASLDVRVYEDAVAALRSPASLASASRDFALGRALSDAADVPLRIAEAAFDVALLAELVATRGDPSMRADSLAALFFADSAAHAASTLVETNLTVTRADERVLRAQELAESASKTRRRALLVSV